MTDRDEPTAAADADLVLRSRSGDRGAFGELWRRHYRSGVVVARSISPAADADDLVQEAYTRIFHSIQRGGGPTGSFRAYLFTSIRNTAADWARARHETTIEELDSLEDPASSEQATADSLDRSLTHQAFRSLPTRWQEVLWYSEIEGMKPAEIAPLLGLKPTAVAQLAFRAREGLREAWVQAHLGSVAEDSDCAWAIARLGAYTRDNLGRRDRPRVERHVASCPRCMIVAGEAREVSSRLAWVLVPLTIGVGGTAGYLATLQTGAPAIALAAMPSAVVQGAASAGAGAGATTAGAGVAVPAAAGAVVSGAAVPGAAGATGATLGVAAGSTTAGGVAAGSVAAGAAGATAVAGTAGGLLSGTGLSVAAAAFAVAGTVAVGVALPATTEAFVAPHTIETSADPSATAARSPASDQAPGPSPADIPAMGPDDAPGAGGPDAGSPGAPGDDDLGPAGEPGAGKSASAATGGGQGATGSGAAGTADDKAKGAGTAEGSATGTASGADGSGSGNGNGNGGAGAHGQGGAPETGAGTGGSVAPAGSGPGSAGAGSARTALPSVVSSSSQQISGATVVEVIVAGPAGATVEARIRGTLQASAPIGADGTALLVLRPSAKDVAADARVELRTVDGAAGGPALGRRLSDLL
ncbi:sigma-70 family RNA polymerase sigma factor [Microbacterium sp. NPDC057407]|uniref:sigma-70 family RNA polymerase sigma factor n=1 Tax=Microbacterium sp. NPDC057407 TaxID=3346120 RepID=UPI00366BD981